MQEVRIDAAAVNAGQRQLEFELLGTPVQALQQRVEALPDGGSVWYGQLQSRSAKLGARAVELLIAQLQRNELGVPAWPTTTTVPARWPV